MEVLRRGVGLLRICDEVASAIHAGRAVVALESTIISHGMPYPQNVETALRVEGVIREQGAVPATVAIIDSALCVGLSHSQIDTLGNAGHSVVKASRRDMAAVIAAGKMGATTVAGTMIGAHAAGIPIFVTGGLGGVHRGGEVSMDISADLTELGRTPVAVVCAGVKSILDIGRTLEFLETQGVTVATVGPAGSEFPAFFSSKSGHTAPYCFPTAEHCAKVIDTNHGLGLQSGIVLGVPIPKEHDAGEAFEALIDAAIREAEQKGVAGKEITPFLLQRVNELTKGRSLDSNIGLVMNNARIGAQIAVSLSDLRRQRSASSLPQKRSFSTISPRRSAPAAAGNLKVPLIVGGATVDIMAHASSKFTMGTTTYGKVQIMHGGVARNIAEALFRLGGSPALATVLGKDASGDQLLRKCVEWGMADPSNHSLVTRDESTATYNAFLSEAGEMVVAVGDMAILERLDRGFVNALLPAVQNASLVCSDGNVTEDGLDALAESCIRSRVPLWFEGTSTQKVLRPINTKRVRDLAVYKMSFLEFCNVSRALLGPEAEARVTREERGSKEFISAVFNNVEQVSSLGPKIVVTLGELGVVAPEKSHCLTDARSPSGYSLYPSAKPASIVNVTGAGDSMMGGLLAASLRGMTVGEAVRVGSWASQMSLESMFPVSPNLKWPTA